MTTTAKPNQLSTGLITSPLIRDFPLSERQRERLRHYWAGHLSNSELLAILLRTGMQGENVLAMASGSWRSLRAWPRYPELASTSCVRRRDCRKQRHAKCLPLLSWEGALLCFRQRIELLSRPQRTSQICLWRRCRMSLLEREELRVVLLNAKNRVMGVERLYQGSVNSALVRPTEVFAEAVKRTCPA